VLFYLRRLTNLLIEMHLGNRSNAVALADDDDDDDDDDGDSPWN
jgi:hypothetical protein